MGKNATTGGVEAIVDAALAVLAAEGAEALGFNRVARQLGVKPPSLYNHVENDADLRRRVAIRGWALLAEAAERARGERSPEQELRRFGQVFRDFARANAGLYAVMRSTRLAPADPLFQPVQARMLAMFEGPLEGLGVPERMRVHAVRALRAAVEGFVGLEHAEQFQLGADVDRSFEYLLDTLIAGFEARGPRREGRARR